MTSPAADCRRAAQPLTPAFSPQAGRGSEPREGNAPARAGTDSGGLYLLLAWLSPGFPVGAFSYSHGLEAAVESGAVRDRASLQSWIAAVVVQGSGRMDADILRDAHRAAAAGNLAALTAVNERGLAYRATAELALETTAQGEAFLGTCRAAWPDEFLGLWAAAGTTVCYPAAVGAATARAVIPLGDALLAYLQAMAANLVSTGLRLGVVGQTDGQRILAALEPVVVVATADAVTRDPSDFGAAAFAVDLASTAHEIQYSRLFRS
jgi:urease accessory protein